jgi:hypothetical protein
MLVGSPPIHNQASQIELRESQGARVVAGGLGQASIETLHQYRGTAILDAPQSRNDALDAALLDQRAQPFDFAAVAGYRTT